MPKTILIHSFHHGVGRSNIAANLAYLLAATGRRVGIIDTDTKSPAIDCLFGLKPNQLTYSFNDYLWSKCDIEQAAYNVTEHLMTDLEGQLFLIAANTKVGETVRALKNAEDVHLLNTGCQSLIGALNLDVLLIDTQPGVNQGSLISITVADTLAIILRPNQRDFQGTSVTVEVVRQLDIPRVVLIVNEVPDSFDFGEVKAEVEKTYNCEVVAVLPHVDEVMALANKDIFALRYPDHPLTALLKATAATLVT